MKIRSILICTLIAFSCTLVAQENVYKFTKVVENPATPIKDQYKTGTCWCFGTTSFIESELIRTGKGEFDLSEMFTVRHNYNHRIWDNHIREGRGSIVEGSLGHMAINMMDKYGLVPQSAYGGINYDSPKHDHNELSEYVAALASVTTKSGVMTPESKELQEALFDIYLGKLPETFEYDGVEYTPLSFKEHLGLDFSQYVDITSFTHLPFYEKVLLELPDNWDNGTMYNVPIEELIEIIDHALLNGYTVVWSGDISEPGYVLARDLSILPQDTGLTRQQILESTEIIPEMEVTQELRQMFYETFQSVDDHLEHITGLYKDQNGVKYYNTKNSWGHELTNTGYHKMSENYVKGKTKCILVHKNSIPENIRKKLGL